MAPTERLKMCSVPLLSFEMKGIPLKNIIGLACDNASVMVGKHNFVMTHLMEVNEHLIVIRCTCHSAHLAASAATACLPKTPEEMLHSIVNYVSGSAKRDSGTFSDGKTQPSEAIQHSLASAA